MSVTPHVAGAAQIWIDAGAGLEELGYTANGAEISGRIYTNEIPGDQNGGDDGPPIDKQIFGSVHRVRLELTSWDGTVANLLLALVPGGTPGIQPDPGSLINASSLTFRLLILSAIEPINYPKATLVDQFELNKGAKYSRLVLIFECLSFTGNTVFNNVTS